MRGIKQCWRPDAATSRQKAALPCAMPLLHGRSLHGSPLQRDASSAPSTAFFLTVPTSWLNPTYEL